jgi:parvulin-like peptidyl-prolyl isomerase
VIIVAPVSLAEPDARADTVIAEQMVARVNGHPVLLSEIRARARSRLAPLRTAGVMERVTATQKIYAEVLEQRIEEEIVAFVASPLRIVIADPEIDVTITAIASQNNMDRDTLLAAAMMQGLTADAYRVEVRHQILRQRVILALGMRDRSIGTYPSDDAGRRAWLARVESGPFAAEKRRACIERWVRW